MERYSNDKIVVGIVVIVVIVARAFPPGRYPLEGGLTRCLYRNERNHVSGVANPGMHGKTPDAPDWVECQWWQGAARVGSCY